MNFPGAPANDDIHWQNNKFYKYNSTSDVWIPTSDLQPNLHWKLRETSGYVNDGGSNENYGTQANCTRNGSYYEFNGTTALIQADLESDRHILNPNLGSFTVSMWIYIDIKDGDTRVIFCTYAGARGVYIRKQADETIRCQSIWQTGYYYFDIPTADWTAAEWFHLTVVFKSGTGIYAYINGELIGSGTSATGGTWNDIPTTLYIGRHSTANHYFDGKMRDIRVFDRVICNQEINFLASNTKYNNECHNKQTHKIGFPTYNLSDRHWKMSGESNVRVSDGGQNLPVNASGSNLTTIMGHIGNRCKVFNGTTAYMYSTIYATDHISNPNLGDFTISAWVYIDAKDSNYRYILDNLAGAAYKGFKIYKDTKDDIYAEVHWSTDKYVVYIDETDYSATTWFNIIVKYEEGTSLKIYYNTILKATDTVAAVDVNTTVPTTLYIGRRALAAQYYLDGRLEDVRIYDYLLNDTEISNIYNDGKGLLI